MNCIGNCTMLMIMPDFAMSTFVGISENC
jgi:hypothetical protein